MNESMDTIVSRNIFRVYDSSEGVLSLNSDQQGPHNCEIIKDPLEVRNCSDSHSPYTHATRPADIY
jgi:hypothetical protein